VEPVRVLGGGVAGLATALLLARRGVDVEVLERGHGRFSGGLQVLENGTRPEDVLVELERLGYGPPSCDLVPLRDAILLGPDLRRHEVSSSEPYAYLVRRGSGPGTLDSWLRRAAEEAGVRVVRASPAVGSPPQVVATGPALADGAARELVFRTDHPDLTVAHFDPRLTPTGYSYLFVRDGLGTIGAA
jgi:choline dehydrogenase-like flavoprotein